MNGDAGYEGDGSRPRAPHTGARVREKKPKSTVKSVINHSSLLEAFTQQSAYSSFRSLNHQARGGGEGKITLHQKHLHDIVVALLSIN
jgi:hypothetical protein